MRKIKLTSILLFVIALFEVMIAQAQSRIYKWRNAEDSLVMVHSRLSRIHPYAGLHLSSDAEMYYLGPSFQAGVDINLTQKLAVSSYLHYFYVGVNNVENRLIQKGRMRTFTGALLIQYDGAQVGIKGSSFASA
ncbi:MAG TPA: hypothetical protein VN726_15610 [Hanamia sp.]|nr:hypothetical protein [Hanamia sp.]